MHESRLTHMYEAHTNRALSEPQQRKCAILGEHLRNARNAIIGNVVVIQPQLCESRVVLQRLSCVAGCCRVLQRVAACCSVLQCVAVCYSAPAL